MLKSQKVNVSFNYENYRPGETVVGNYAISLSVNDTFGHITIVIMQLTIVDNVPPVLTLFEVSNFFNTPPIFNEASYSNTGNQTSYYKILLTNLRINGFDNYFPDARAIDFFSIDYTSDIDETNNTPNNSLVQLDQSYVTNDSYYGVGNNKYSVEDLCGNKTDVQFLYKIINDIQPTIIVEYSKSSNGVYITYSSGNISVNQYDYLEFRLTMGPSSKPDNSYTRLNAGIFSTTSTGTIPTTFSVIESIPDSFKEGRRIASETIDILVNEIPYVTLRILDNGGNKILQMRYNTYLSYICLYSITLFFTSSIDSIYGGMSVSTSPVINTFKLTNYSSNNRKLSIDADFSIGSKEIDSIYRDNGEYFTLVNLGSADSIAISSIQEVIMTETEIKATDQGFTPFSIPSNLIDIHYSSILQEATKYKLKSVPIFSYTMSELQNKLIYLNETAPNYNDISNNPNGFFSYGANREMYDDIIPWYNNGTNPPPTIQDYYIDNGDIIIQSRYKLIPGIINGDQDLGDGLPYAMNVFDPSECILYYLTVIDLDNDILFNIDQSDNIYISCLPNSIYKNMQIWTILFNIFDVSGWLLLANQDVELNTINSYGYDSNSNFDISLSKIEISGISNISNDKFLLECSQNILSLKTTDIGSDICGEIIDNIYFNIKDENGIILDNSMIFLLLTPFTGYELGLGDSTYNFIIRKTGISNTTNLIIGNQPQVFAKIFPYGYNILPNVSYFNINNITVEENNLLKLDTSGVLLGKLNFLSS